MDEEVAVKSYRSLELCPPVKIPRKSLVVELIAKSEPVGVVANKEYDRTKKKYQQLLKKQETLLRVALYLLLNLAEDTHVEQKMRNKGLVPQLLTLLDRENQELLILVVSFLKKLSIFLENKDEMAAGGIMKRLMNVVPCDNEILVNVALRLLLNLSFDPALRQEMVRIGMMPQLVTLLNSENHRMVVLCILYHITMEEKSRSTLAYTDCVPQVMRLILECPDELVEPEVIALGINLASSRQNSQLMCKGPGLKLLMRRVLNTQDSLLMKMIRNISQHPGPTKRLFLSYLSELGGIVANCEDEECVVEALGILGNLSIPEIDFERVVRELNLLPFIVSKLKDPSVQDDLLLEVVIVCGTFSLDQKCAASLVQEGLPDLLITVLKAKQEDDELVLQIVFLFHQLVLQESTRELVIKHSQAPDYLLELMNDKNKEICKLCSKTLDVIAEYDKEFASKIQCERFRWHNFQWLEIMTGQTYYEEEETDEDYLDPHYLHMAAELYDNPELYYEMQNQLESAHGGGGVGIEPSSTAYAEYGDGMPYTDRQVLSPQQYAMLMNSMQDPLAMYASTLVASSPVRRNVDTEVDYGGDNTLGDITLGDSVYGETLEYADHPAFAMMSTGYPSSVASPHRPAARTGF